MRMFLSCLAFLLATAASGGPRAAPCERLAGAKKKLADKLITSVYAYDCCDETLHRCLKRSKVCKLVKRLRDAICRRVGRGQNEQQIRRAIDRRARSMTAVGKKAAFALAGAPAAGDAGAPVTVVAYACARCPFCSKLLPDLHREVTRGALKGKVKLYFRPFPIRGHDGSVEGGLALVAAAKMGKPWEYMNKLFAEFNRFSKDKLFGWAKQLGLDEVAFKATMADRASRSYLVESKKEGLRNKVTATPTLFINGYKYHGEMDVETVRDVLEEAYDRTQKQQYCR